ncbi:hypothetical protein [Parablautia muri]|uniref:Uncharacterized protein n=1 Tax=Parablautia muri TaxID=2320879 RepID=A0A9X5BE67_9FIRM|nr:hypothetical protein [Parablautia muri]NBJ91807.1 hypothetical protein [Parablautia muri]
MNHHKNNWVIKFFILSVFLSITLTGCGPSEEKIAQAQEAYTALTQLHNEVVEAHNHISDNSLDQALIALAAQVKEIETHNLNELKDEEIDVLLDTMSSLTDSYEEYLNEINTIQEQETAAILTEIPLTLQNNTEMTFHALALYSEDNVSQNTDVLEDTSGLSPGQYLAGLIIYKDASATPWILKLENAEGTSYEIQLPVNTYKEDGVSLTLTYDSEQNEIKCS